MSPAVRNDTQRRGRALMLRNIRKSRALGVLAALVGLSLPAAATAPAATSVAPAKARPANVDKAVRRDPMARRKAQPKLKPRERTAFDLYRLQRAEARRARRRLRPQGWTP